MLLRCEFTVRCKLDLGWKIVRLTVNSQWKVAFFTPKCSILLWNWFWFVKSTSLIFFLLLAVRPAQTHPGPYGPRMCGLTTTSTEVEVVCSSFSFIHFLFEPLFLLWNPASSWISHQCTTKWDDGPHLKVGKSSDHHINVVVHQITPVYSS